MKKYCCYVIAMLSFGALLPNLAYAEENATANVSISGEAAPICSIDTTVEWKQNWNLGQITNLRTGKLEYNGGILTIGKVKCTTDAYISIKSTHGYLGKGETCNNATPYNCIYYSASATWNNGSDNYTINTVEGSSEKASTDVTAGSGLLTLDLTFSNRYNNQNNYQILAGTYADIVTVQLGSQL